MKNLYASGNQKPKEVNEFKEDGSELVSQDTGSITLNMESVGRQGP